MSDARDLRRLALALENVSEHSHFDRRAFRTPRRIFATLAGDGLSANLCLEPAHQEALVRARPDAFHQLSGAWGAQGWTSVQLAEVDVPELADALREAHALVAAPAAKPRASAKAKPKASATAKPKASAKAKAKPKASAKAKAPRKSSR